MDEREFDAVVKRRQRPRHIKEPDSCGGLLLRFGQIGEYIKKYLRDIKQYNDKVEFVDFNPVNAMEVFGVQNNGSMEIEIDKFFNIGIFSKVQINIFLEKMFKDFGGKLPLIGLVFMVSEMLDERHNKLDVNLKNLMQNEENFENPGLFRNTPFACNEKTRFCAMLLPLKCNPIYKGKRFEIQCNLACECGLEIITAIEISYCFLAFKELFGGFYPYVPEFLSTSSEMEVAENGGRLKRKVVLVGDNCDRWNHSHGNKPGIRLSTSNGEPAMHIGAAAALVRVFTDEDLPI